jgi:hypothetical protein
MQLFSGLFLANASVASVLYEAWSVITTTVISSNHLSAVTINGTNFLFVGRLGWCRVFGRTILSE